MSGVDGVLLRQMSSDELFYSVCTVMQNANSKDGILVVKTSTFVCSELTSCTWAVVFPQPSVFNSGDRLASNSPKPQDSGTFLVISGCQCIESCYSLFYFCLFAIVLEDFG